jgi:hypothetical protein
MTPPKTTTSTSVPKKQQSQLTTTLVVEETPEASSSTLRFPMDYIPPRNPPPKIVTNDSGKATNLGNKVSKRRNFELI